MAIVRFTCPECDEVFKASTAPSPGKKVKCPACKHAFVPPDDEDEEEEDQPRGKAKTPAKKITAKKRRRDDDDEDDEEEDDDDDDDDVPVKKKKKKSSASAVLYWVYRGVSVLVLLILLGVLAWVLLNRRSPALNIELVVPLAPAVTEYRTIDAVSKNQDVNVSAQAISGQFDLYVFLEKDRAEAEGAIIGRKQNAKILASSESRPDADLKFPVPANEHAVIRLSSADGKKAEVKLKITN